MTPQPPPGSPPRAPEGSLSETREELELIFNLVPDLICVASAEGFFTRVNPAWEKTLGWMPVGLLAQPFEKFVHPDDLQKTRDQFASQLSGGSAIHFVNRYRTRSGDYRWLDWVATPITGGASVYAAARDITERKRAEELENAQRELLAKKLAAEETARNKARFLDIAAHELRTPITSISLLVQVAKQQLKKGTLVSTEPFEKLQDPVERLTQLVVDLLDLSRLDRGLVRLRLERANLATAVHQAVHEFEQLYPTRQFLLSQPQDSDETAIEFDLGHALKSAKAFAVTLRGTRSTSCSPPTSPVLTPLGKASSSARCARSATALNVQSGAGGTRSGWLKTGLKSLYSYSSFSAGRTKRGFQSRLN